MGQKEVGVFYKDPVISSYGKPKRSFSNKARDSRASIQGKSWTGEHLRRKQSKNHMRDGNFSDHRILETDQKLS